MVHLSSSPWGEAKRSSLTTWDGTGEKQFMHFGLYMKGFSILRCKCLCVILKPVPAKNVFRKMDRKGLDIPRFVHEAFKITTTLDTGVVYLAEVVDEEKLKDSQLSGVGSNKQVVIKIIYSAFDRQNYGLEAHGHLASKNMAPKLYGVTAPTPHEFIEQGSLEHYIHMEYLSPPSDGKAGWISLHDLGSKYPLVAEANKSQIMKSIKAIINELEEKGLVHGDFRTNNLLVYVKTGQSCTLELKDGEPYIKVIDFDWSREAGKTRSPTSRNQEVKWPGQDGMYMLLGEDQQMVDLWSPTWPDVGQRKPFLQADGPITL